MPEEVRFPSGECLPVVDGADDEGEEYWDPNDSGNPLLDTSTEELRNTQLAENFVAGEFARSGGNRFEKCRIDPEFVECLQSIRDAVGEPVVIHSGYRSWEYNFQEIYDVDWDDVTMSEHCSGRGADVRIEGMTPVEMADVALRNWGLDVRVGVGNETNMRFHVDVKPREEWPDEDGMWSYPNDEDERPDGWDDLQTLREERDEELAENDEEHDCE